MDHSAHNKIVSFISSIVDDFLRDVCVRGKYRDVILPMIVLRRLECLLEPSKEAVMEEVKFQRDDAGFMYRGLAPHEFAPMTGVHQKNGPDRKDGGSFSCPMVIPKGMNKKIRLQIGV